MKKIQIILEIEDEQADPDDSTGVTNETWQALYDALSSFGTDINIQPYD